MFLDMAVEGDKDAQDEFLAELDNLKKGLKELETKSLLCDKWDECNCYISINSGAGGLEACDWAGMLHRMFVRFGQSLDFKVEEVSTSPSEEGGIKSATILIEGAYAFGLLKAEVGVHRLVRISPYDSAGRRHTSFASVFVWPEIVDENSDFNIPTEELRIDTYRASGAGGQHINTTDSAVRITHVPTGLVVQCQNQRSQHKNKDRAMKMLISALRDLEKEKQDKKIQEVTAEKRINEWGSQIRSYILHPYKMVKDHRTLVEKPRPDLVLDGDLFDFVHEFLKQKSLGQWKGKS